MKTIVFTFYILAQLINFSTLGYADDVAMAATLDNVPHTITGGVIKSVSWADSSKSKKSEIVVVDGAGKKINIYVMSTTTLWDVDAKAIMQDQITLRKK